MMKKLIYEIVFYTRIFLSIIIILSMIRYFTLGLNQRSIILATICVVILLLLMMIRKDK
jgi:hypothetical protein